MASYDHTQTLAAATWVIVHNLDEDIVSTDVFIDYNGGKEKVLPKRIFRTDFNTLTIEFSEAQSGVARVVAKDHIV